MEKVLSWILARKQQPQPLLNQHVDDIPSFPALNDVEKNEIHSTLRIPRHVEPKDAIIQTLSRLNGALASLSQEKETSGTTTATAAAAATTTTTTTTSVDSEEEEENSNNFGTFRCHEVAASSPRQEAQYKKALQSTGTRGAPFRLTEEWEINILALEKGEWADCMSDQAFGRWKKERPKLQSFFPDPKNTSNAVQSPQGPKS